MIKDMLDTITDMVLMVIQRTGEKVPIDCISIHEDMAGKSGPLFGPIQIRDFLNPYYRKIWDCAQNYGARLFSQDSDGNMTPVIDEFLECRELLNLPPIRKEGWERMAF